jgi:hypothetical protein
MPLASGWSWQEGVGTEADYYDASGVPWPDFSGVFPRLYSGIDPMPDARVHPIYALASGRGGLVVQAIDSGIVPAVAQVSTR